MVAASFSIPLHANFVAHLAATSGHHAAMASCVKDALKQWWPARSSAFLVPYAANACCGRSNPVSEISRPVPMSEILRACASTPREVSYFCLGASMSASLQACAEAVDSC